MKAKNQNHRWMPAGWLALGMLSSLAVGSPTRRPLPPGVIDNHTDWHVLRDHEDVNLLHLVPKQYVITQNELRSYGGDQGANCEAAEKHDKALRELVEAKLRHAEVSKKRLESLLKLSDDIQTISSLQLKSLLEKKNLEGKLKDETLTPEAKKKIQDELADAERWLKTFDEKLANLEKFRTVAEKEQTESLKQISELETSLAKFDEQVKKPAGQVHIRLRIPGEPDAKKLTETLGLSAKHRVELAKVVGISLLPTTAEDLGFRETLKRDAIGNYTPDWNIKPLTVQPTWFGSDELPQNVEWGTIEREISFEHIASLAMYCAHKRANTSDKLLTAIAIKYDVPLWSSNRAGVNVKEVIAHRVRLDNDTWKELTAIPAAKVAVPVDSDLGDPRLFMPKGKFDRGTFPVSFRFELSQKKENK